MGGSHLLGLVRNNVCVFVSSLKFMLLTGILKAPETAISIVSSLISCHAPETSRMDRYRNELASSLPSKTPLLTLRKLVAATPDPESDAVFLSSQRAVNVVKACRSMIEDDEAEEDEDMEGIMAQLFSHLAPILQGVPGGHWDFILDVMENNLEVGSFLEMHVILS